MDIQQRLLSTFTNGGYFVEAGAHDGVGDSQTKILEDKGWAGICIEPSSAFVGLKRSRKCHVDNRCLFDADRAFPLFREMSGNAVELSGLVNHFQDDRWDRSSRPHKDRAIESVTLTTILQQYNAPGVIEFLSLDTEGSEPIILGCHDFERFRFLTMMVEYNGVDAHKLRLIELLAPKGYLVAYDDKTNLLFVDRGGVWDRTWNQ